MNPTTGTFISMDAYSGTTDNPVSQHKYLYANANPVTYEDPSGYMSSMNLLLTAAMIPLMSGLASGIDFMLTRDFINPDGSYNISDMLVYALEGFIFGGKLEIGLLLVAYFLPEAVIIDGRNTGLTLDDANTVIERALGKYGGELPGIVEIWTTEGILRR